jgi:hypothetical protein
MPGGSNFDLKSMAYIEIKRIVMKAEAVKVKESKLRRYDWERYSGRQVTWQP